MKETKVKKIEVRLTPEEKELFKTWCEERETTMSDYIRSLIERAIRNENNK